MFTSATHALPSNPSPTMRPPWSCVWKHGRRWNPLSPPSAQSWTRRPPRSRDYGKSWRRWNKSSKVRSRYESRAETAAHPAGNVAHAETSVEARVREARKVQLAVFVTQFFFVATLSTGIYLISQRLATAQSPNYAPPPGALN